LLQCSTEDIDQSSAACRRQERRRFCSSALSSAERSSQNSWDTDWCCTSFMHSLLTFVSILSPSHLLKLIPG